MAKFTAAQMIASLHRHTLAIAQEFDEALTTLIQDPSIARVEDSTSFVHADGRQGVRISIIAETLSEAEVAAEQAKLRARPDA
jgi:hypothetical protein